MAGGIFYPPAISLLRYYFYHYHYKNKGHHNCGALCFCNGFICLRNILGRLSLFVLLPRNAYLDPNH